MFESWFKAKGYNWHEYAWLQTMKAMGKNNDCYICGRNQRRLLGWVELIPIYDEQLEAIKYICSDHGGIWWNCLTGQEVIFSHKPYWQRRVRDFWYNITQKVIIPIRFIWFFIVDIYFWHIAIWGYLFYRELKRKICES